MFTTYAEVAEWYSKARWPAKGRVVGQYRVIKRGDDYVVYLTNHGNPLVGVGYFSPDNTFKFTAPISTVLAHSHTRTDCLTPSATPSASP